VVATFTWPDPTAPVGMRPTELNLVITVSAPDLEYLGLLVRFPITDSIGLPLPFAGVLVTIPAVDLKLLLFALLVVIHLRLVCAMFLIQRSTFCASLPLNELLDRRKAFRTTRASEGSADSAACGMNMD